MSERLTFLSLRKGKRVSAHAARMTARHVFHCDACDGQVVPGVVYWRVNAFENHVVCAGCAGITSTTPTLGRPQDGSSSGGGDGQQERADA